LCGGSSSKCKCTRIQSERTQSAHIIKQRYTPRYAALDAHASWFVAVSPNAGLFEANSVAQSATRPSFLGRLFAPKVKVLPAQPTAKGFSAIFHTTALPLSWSNSTKTWAHCLRLMNNEARDKCEEVKVSAKHLTHDKDLVLTMDAYKSRIRDQSNVRVVWGDGAHAHKINFKSIHAWHTHSSQTLIYLYIHKDRIAHTRVTMLPPCRRRRGVRSGPG
jgi:hypothetical protein